MQRWKWISLSSVSAAVVLALAALARTDVKSTFEAQDIPAQYLALGRLQGEFHLSARPKGETQMAPMEMASYWKLFR